MARSVSSKLKENEFKMGVRKQATAILSKVLKFKRIKHNNFSYSCSQYLLCAQKRMLVLFICCQVTIIQNKAALSICP